jgi:hypothetical protein
MAAPLDLGAVTLPELLDDSKLNAKKFAGYFGDFAYEFNNSIQPASVFLSRAKGDCDDYSVLADFVLKKHGLETRLIHIRLTGRVAQGLPRLQQPECLLHPGPLRAGYPRHRRQGGRFPAVLLDLGLRVQLLLRKPAKTHDRHDLQNR